MKHLLNIRNINGAEIEQANEIHKREIIITGEYAQRVIDLTARAEAAEARADAAVKDIYKAEAEAALEKEAQHE